MSKKDEQIHHPANARFQSGNRVYKVVVLGQGGVGKSALTLQFVMHTFQEDHDPTIEDAYQIQGQIDGHVCILDVLDTAGQDEFTAMREQYMRGGEGFLLVYSITNKRSFNEMRRYRETVNRVRNYEKVPIILVGNKSDLESRREVSFEDGEELAKEFGCPFFETSAALRANVDESFHSVVRCIRKKEKADYTASLKRSGKLSGNSDGSHSTKLGALFCCVKSPTSS